MRIRRLFGGNDIIMNAFWQLLIVMTVAELASSLATMIDGIILSRYLGENAIAAHGLMAPYFNLLKMLGGFFAVGTQVTCSGYIGRGNLPKACRAFTVSSIVLLVVSVSFGVAILLFSAPISLMLGAALDPENLLDPTRYYLVGLSIGLPFTLGTIFLIPIVALNGDKARIALATNTMMIVNIVGDLANVFVLNGGMLGMALATTVSYLCSFTILLLHFRKGEGVGFKRSGLSLAVFVGVARAGTLASFTRLCSLVKSYAINIIYLSYASTMVLAANTLVQSNTKVALICIATAIGQTALVMASYLYGERDRDGIIKVFRAAVSVSFGPCLILSVVLFVFAEPIVSLFTSNQELILLATDALRIFIIGFPIIGVKMFYINFFQASRNSAMSCLSSIVGELVYITVTSFLFVQWFGIIGLWAAYPASELLYLITVFIAACIRYRHIPRTIDEILFLDPGFDVPPERMLSINIRSREQVGTIHNKVMAFCTEQGLSTRMATAFSFASEEMVSEIFDYAYAEGKKRQLKYCMKVKDDEIVIFTRDEFESFDLTEEGKVPKDDFLADIGIHLMFKLADDVMYIAVFNLNNLVIRIDRHKLPVT